MLESARFSVANNIRAFMRNNGLDKCPEKVFSPYYSEFRFQFECEGLSLVFAFGLDNRGIHCRTYLNDREVWLPKAFALWSIRQNLDFGFYGFEESSKIVYFEVNLPILDAAKNLPTEEVFVDLFSSITSYLTGPRLLSCPYIQVNHSNKRYSPNYKHPLWVERVESFDPIYKMIKDVKCIDGGRSCKEIGVTGTYVTRYDLKLWDFCNCPVSLSLMENAAVDLMYFQSFPPYSSFCLDGSKLLMRVLVVLDEPVHLSTESDHFSLFLDAERGRVKLEDTEKWDDLGFDFLSDD